MSYIPSVPRDHFEPEEVPRGGFDIPCCWCKHRHGRDADEPCRTCDHNANAVQPTVWPFPSVLVPLYQPGPDEALL